MYFKCNVIVDTKLWIVEIKEGKLSKNLSISKQLS